MISAPWGCLKADDSDDKLCDRDSDKEGGREGFFNPKVLHADVMCERPLDRCHRLDRLPTCSSSIHSSHSVPIQTRTMRHVSLRILISMAFVTGRGGGRARPEPQKGGCVNPKDLQGYEFAITASMPGPHP